MSDFAEGTGNSIKKLMVTVVSLVGAVLASGAFIAFILFAAAIARRAYYWVSGDTFPFVSIGNYLELEGVHRGILTWDQSFILLGVGIAGLVLVNGLGEFLDWFEKTPEKRAEERSKRREAAETERRLQAEERQASRARKAAHRAERKPMSGWRRLWLVLSVLLGAFAFLLANDNYSQAWADVAWNGDNEAFWQAAHANPRLSNCDWGTAEAKYPNGGSYTVYCQTADPWLFALIWAFFPAVIMAAVGLTVRWVYRGFRAHSANSEGTGSL